MFFPLAAVVLFLTQTSQRLVSCVPITDSPISSTTHSPSQPMTKALYDPLIPNLSASILNVFPPPRGQPPQRRPAINQTKVQIASTTARPVVDIGDETSSSPGAMSLLYVFSEASKRLPIAELPSRVESMGNSVNNWVGEAGKYVEKHAVSFSDTLMEYLTSAAGEAVKRSGEIITTTIDSLERTVKGYMADWIGCRPQNG